MRATAPAILFAIRSLLLVGDSAPPFSREATFCANVVTTATARACSLLDAIRRFPLSVGETMDLKDLGVTIRELLRYGYAGGLALLLLWWLAPEQRPTMEKAGAVGVTLGCLVFGVFIYSIYKVLICDTIFAPLVEFVHRRAQKNNCMHELLEKHGVHRGHRMDAFRVIRDTKFSEAIRERFHVQNTELHTVYVTAFELLVAALLAALFAKADGKTAMLVVVAGIVTFIVGALGQIAVCRQECAHFLSLGLDNQSVSTLLKSCQLLTDSATQSWPENGAPTGEIPRGSADRVSRGGEKGDTRN
jgi:hypothetical protein